MNNKSYSVDGHKYSINVKKVKGNDYYVVNFRADGKAVGKSTGMKPDKDSFSQVEERARQIVSDYFAKSASTIDTLSPPDTARNILSTLTPEQIQALTAAILVHVQTAGLNPQPSANGMLFNDFAEDWLKRKKSKLSNTTYMNYESIVRKHLEPYFSGKYLSDIKPMHLEEYIDKKKTEISVNTVSKHISLMGSILENAVKNGFLQSNPARMLDGSLRKERPKNSFYGAEELTHLLSVSKGTEIEVPVFLAVMFGLRRSEVIGLKWSDIDFNGRTLTINGSVTRICEDGRWTDTYDNTLKTNASYKTFPLNDAVCGYFKRLYEHNMKMISNFADSKEYICVNAVGERLKLDYITHKFTKLLAQNGLRHIRFHDLRHSCLSILANDSSFTMKQVQGYARHANFKTTADIYSHLDSSATLRELDALCSVLNFV